jgi:hypothetical protein
VLPPSRAPWPLDAQRRAEVALVARRSAGVALVAQRCAEVALVARRSAGVALVARRSAGVALVARRSAGVALVARRSAGVVLVAAAAALLACGSSSEGREAGTSGAQRVVLGTGEAEFESMDGEPRIRLVHGAQGGFHVWASFLAYGFASQALDLTLTTLVEGASENLVMHARLTTRELLDVDGTPARSFAGFPGQVRDARCADGRRVELQLHLSEPGGGAADDVRHCIAELDEELRSTECP